MFDQIKQNVTVPMALSKYTTWNGKRRALCPFHTGSSVNSMSVREKTFCCFSCGSSGDVVKLVSLLMNTSQKQAAEIIENDFGLTKPADLKAAQREYEAKQRELKREKTIENCAFILLSEYIRWCETQKSRITDESYLDDKNIIEALRNQEIADGIWRMLFEADQEERKAIIGAAESFLRRIGNVDHPARKECYASEQIQ